MAAPPKMRRLAAKGFNVPDEIRPFVEQLLDTTNSFFADTSNALNKRLTLAANVVSEVKSVTVYAPEPAWTAITVFDTAGVSEFGAGWVPPRYRMEPGGRVHLQFALNVPTTAAAFNLFTLPVGYRPEYLTPAWAYFDSGASLGLLLRPNGEIGKRTTTSAVFLAYQGTHLATTPANPAAFEGVGWPIVLTPQRVQMHTGACIIPLRYQDADDLNASVPAYTPDWALDANGNIIIKSLWGLTPGRRYHLHYLIIQ